MTTAKLEDAAHVEELMLEAEEAIEASQLPEDDREGVDLGLGTSKATISVEDAGYVRIWDRRSGEESVVLRHPDYLRRQLDKRDETGRRIFTTVRPDITPFRGTYKCPLHPEAENAQRYREMGMPTCKKSNLRNSAEAQRHLEKKHKETWQTLERIRERELQDEDRMFQRQMLGALVQNAEPAPAPAPAAVEAEKPETVKVECPEPDCSEVFEAKNRGGINLKLRNHNRKEHMG